MRSAAAIVRSLPSAETPVVLGHLVRLPGRMITTKPRRRRQPSRGMANLREQVDMTQANPACANPTKKYPEGRTGTIAGYKAHRAASEVACAPCVAAWTARCSTYTNSLSPDARERRNQRHNDQRRERRAQRAEDNAACATPTPDYPEGRRGTAAGHAAHVEAGQYPCRSCREAPVAPGTVCGLPTLKHPGGRTGTPAGYQAHLGAGEEACAACTASQSASSLIRLHGLPEADMARYREQNAAACRRWRSANPDDARETKHRVIARNRAAVQEAKSRPCTDCGISYPYYVMQFDHLDAGTKEFNVSAGVTRASHERLLAEIAKCEVVCANCHAERTHQRALARKGAKADA